MLQLENFPEARQLREIEAIRQSKVLLLSASHLDFELLPALFDWLSAMGKVKRLDVLLQCRGGVVNATRRIALLLRHFCEHLTFIVPYYCESSGTILSLAADEVLAGELAIFSPIDPHLHGGAEGADATAVSSQDVRQFGSMSEAWFGVEPEQARAQSLSLLCQNLFPPTLAAFYRAELELRQIAEELLAFQLPERTLEQRQQVIETLMTGFHSHSYAITPEQMQALGLRIERQPVVEQLAWTISKALQRIVGGGLRRTTEAPWCDALLADSERFMLRFKSTDGFLPEWSEPKSCL